MAGNGEIQLIFGPMFSGKSTELLRRVRRFVVAKKQCVVLKHANDTRYAPCSTLTSAMDEFVGDGRIPSNDSFVFTHDLLCVPAHTTGTLHEFHTNHGELVGELDVIGIDEGQFFSDIVKYAEFWAGLGIVVIVAALDGTFQRKPFNAILNLVPLAESVVKLTAVCQFCKEDASFSFRIGSETQTELVGGEDKYHAVCRKCYLEHER